MEAVEHANKDLRMQELRRKHSLRGEIPLGYDSSTGRLTNNDALIGRCLQY